MPPISFPSHNREGHRQRSFIFDIGERRQLRPSTLLNLLTMTGPLSILRCLQITGGNG
jgi:hypothetical protein